MGRRHDIGGELKVAIANASENSGAASLITAGGTGDGTENEGQTIDAKGFGSLKLSVSGLASLADTKSISLGCDIQESADGSTWDTAVELYAATVVATGTTGGTNEYFEKETSVSMEGRKRYVRFNVTGTMSATGTDTALYSAVAVLGGAHLAPAA